MPWQVPQTFVFRVCEVYLACCKGFERFLLLTNHCGDQYAYREGQTERTLTHFLRDGCFGTMEPSRMHVLVASLGRQQNSRIHVDRVLFNFFFGLVLSCFVLRVNEYPHTKQLWCNMCGHTSIHCCCADRYFGVRPPTWRLFVSFQVSEGSSLLTWTSAHSSQTKAFTTSKVGIRSFVHSFLRSFFCPSVHPFFPWFLLLFSSRFLHVLFFLLSFVFFFFLPSSSFVSFPRFVIQRL